MPASAVKEINVGANLVPAMLSGRVDATLGAFWNYEAIQLAMLKKHPNVIHMEQVGVPSYDELVVVVRKGTIVNHPDVVRRFVQALGHGYEAVRRDPQAAVASLVHASPGLDPKLQLASVRATLPAFFPSNPANPWGWQDPQQWTRLRQVDAEAKADLKPKRGRRRLDQRAAGRPGPALTAPGDRPAPAGRATDDFCCRERSDR